MQKYQNNVQTLDGRAIVGASVTVTEYPGGAPATVYNSNGSGVITQPILTNGDGEFAFYAANGRYQLQITGGGISVAQSITDVILFDPADSAIDGFTSVSEFGVIGNGSNDDTVAILAATTAGVPLTWPAGVYKITDTITCSTEQKWLSLGGVTIRYAATNGTAIKPAIDFRSTAFIDGDFTVDHGADIGSYTPPTVYNGNVISGSAILVQGDYSTVENIKVQNAWDNGVAVIRIDPSTGAATAGSPKYWKVSGVRTYNCGVGVHAGLTPGKIGAGVDVGSGSAGVVSDCVDFNSYIGFILDLGAGAQASFSNCTAWFTQLDSGNPSNGSGYGFFIGSGDSTFVNCVSVGSGYRGFWYDGTANNCNLTNCYAYIPQKDGFFVKGGTATFDNCRVKGAGVAAANTYDAFLIDSSAGNIAELQFSNCSTSGSNHRYGFNATGANAIKASIIGGSIAGVTSAFNLGAYSIGLIRWDGAGGTKFGVNRPSPGVEWDIFGKLRASANVANSSYITTPFGDSGSNGTFFIEDFATPGKRIAMGYDPVNDVSVIQSMHAGVLKKPLLLNPSGGRVGVGGATTDAIGFYGSAGAAKPTVSGSRGGNAALASLLTQLASLGLIVDGTSA